MRISLSFPTWMNPGGHIFVSTSKPLFFSGAKLFHTRELSVPLQNLILNYASEFQTSPSMSKQMITKDIHNLRLSLHKEGQHTELYSDSQKKLQTLLRTLHDQIHSDVPQLEIVMKYVLQSQGKSFRPKVLFLLNKHLAYIFATHTSSQQYQMIKAVEMIHVASLMHDDVLDDAPIRRGKPSAKEQFGNKQAILGGDFLLAKSCGIAASFGIPSICTRTANIVQNLIEGELIQAIQHELTYEATIKNYLLKTYYKTAALIAEACAAGATLGGFETSVQELCFTFGANVGLAFQIYDDYLDMARPTEAVGKPVLNDIKLGLVTAPTLFASSLYGDVIQTSIHRNLLSEMDVERNAERILEYVKKSNALQLSERLALLYGTRAIETLKALPSQFSSSPYLVAISSLLATILSH